MLVVAVVDGGRSRDVDAGVGFVVLLVLVHGVVVNYEWCLCCCCCCCWGR